jgi:hypothetical protein
MEVRSSAEFELVFDKIAEQRFEVVVAAAGGLMYQNRKLMAQAALARHLR